MLGAYWRGTSTLLRWLANYTRPHTQISDIEDVYKVHIHNCSATCNGPIVVTVFHFKDAAGGNLVRGAVWGQFWTKEAGVVSLAMPACRIGAAKKTPALNPHPKANATVRHRHPRDDRLNRPHTHARAHSKSFGSLQIPPLGILDYGSCQC
jgi:hypothetical protein